MTTEYPSKYFCILTFETQMLVDFFTLTSRQAVKLDTTSQKLI